MTGVRRRCRLCNTGGVDQIDGDLQTVVDWINTLHFKWYSGSPEIAFYTRTNSASGTVRIFQCATADYALWFVSDDCGGLPEVCPIGYVDSAASLCGNSKRIWVLEWATNTADFGQYVTTSTCAATSLLSQGWTPRPDIAWYAWDFQPPDSCPAPW